MRVDLSSGGTGDNGRWRLVNGLAVVVIAGISVLAAGPAQAGYIGPGPGPPPSGPQTLIFQNASGGSFTGNNWGGTAYLMGDGPLPPMPPDYQENEYTGVGYSGFMFQAAPKAADTAVLETLSTGGGTPSNVLPTFPGGLYICCSAPDAIGYVYPQLPAGTKSYSVTMGSGTVAQLDAISSGNASVGAAPNLVLSGAFTATNLAVLETLDGATPVTVSGSGSLSSDNVEVAGAVNVTGGILHATDNFTIDSATAGYTPTGTVSSATLTMTGANSVLQSVSALYVGQTANNLATLDLEGGASATTSNVYVAVGSANTNGKIILNGGSKITTNGGFGAIGYNGTGELDIMGGSNWTLNGSSGAMYISGGAGSIGRVQVSGSGSALNAGGYLFVGQAGQGTLDVGSGATVTGSQGVYVSNDSGSTGTLDISSGGKVQANVDGGATAYAAILGGESGTNGSAIIDGSGSAWTVADSMRIGADGTGSVTVQNGGKLEVDGASLEVGSLKGGTGTLTINGSASSVVLPDGALVVGSAGTGTVMLTNGATLDQSNKTLVLGSQATGNGTIQVQSGSTFNVANLTLGGAGTGELDIGSTDDNGIVTNGTANITGTTIVIGSGKNSKGVLQINGKSTLNFSGSFQDGVSGAGLILLQSGASLSTSTLTLGAATGGYGDLRLETASNFTSNGSVTLGGSGTGDLSVLGGSSATIGGDLILGQNFDSGGSLVTVTGENGSTSKLTVSGDLVIGQADQLSADNVNASVGGQINVAKAITVGGATTEGSLDVKGNGMTGAAATSTQYGAPLTVNAAGSVDVSNSGVLMTSGGGGTDNVAGKVTVEGESSDWRASSIIALAGNGSLTINSGAHAETGSLNIDQAGSGAANVTIDGTAGSTGSQLTLNNALNIDNGGTLTLSDGAILNGAQLSTINVGEGSGTASLDVRGADTTFNGGKAPVAIGTGGSGLVAVSAGATMDVGDILMGQSGSLSVRSGATFTARNVTDNTGGSPLFGDISIITGGTLNVNSVQQPNASFTLTNGTLNVTGGDLSLDGDLTAESGSTVKVNGILKALGTPGRIGITDSTLTASGIQLGSSQVMNVTDSVLNLSGEMNISGSDDVVDFDNASTVKGLDTIIDAGQFNIGNHISVSGVLLRNGVINLNSTGTLVIGMGPATAPAGGSQLLIGKNGDLSGTGIIIANTFTNGGVFHVGDDPGIISIVGNYVQTPGGTLQIEVGPTSTSQVDVSGTATLAGTLALEPVDGASIRLGQSYDVLNAKGGISGAFSAYDSGSQFITLAPQLAGSTLNFTAVHAPNSFADVAQTANQAAVAGVLDAAADNPAGGLADGINTLSNAPAAAVQASFDTLSGEAYGDIATVAIEQSRGFSAAMLERLRDVADGAGDNVGIALTGDGSNFGFRPEAAPAQAGASGLRQRAYSVWAEGSGDFSNNTGGADGSHSFNTSTSGIVAGVDAGITPNWVAGAAFGYGYSDLDASTLQSNATLDNYDFALYSGATFGRVYVRGDAGYVSGNASLTRGLDVAGMQSGATGSPGSRQMFGALETGENFALAPGLSLTPYARLDAARYWQDSVDESNAGVFGLLVAGQQVNSLQTTLGSGLAKSFGAGSAAPLTLTVRAGWAHEFAQTGRPVLTAFVGAPGQDFTVQAAPVNRNTAVVSTGLSMATGRANVFIRYDGQYGSLQSSSAITGGFVFAW